jgi:hypothetical protein
MQAHRVKRHRSATAIVREFLGPQLAVLPEELIWVPAHPSYPDDGGFTYDEILKAVRMQKHWAFVRVPNKGKDAAVIHWYAADDVPLSEVAHMLGHELGHISGTILANDAAEERRADLYGDVAKRVFELLTGQRASKGRRQAGSSPAGRANRQALASAKPQGAVRLSPRTAPTPALVQVRKRPKG